MRLIPNSGEFLEGKKQRPEIHSAKAHRCVDKVGAKGHDESSAWAICTASIGADGVYAKGHGGSASPKRRTRETGPVEPLDHPLFEYNTCHNPAGSSSGGQFCSTDGGGSGRPNRFAERPGSAAVLARQASLRALAVRRSEASLARSLDDLNRWTDGGADYGLKSDKLDQENRDFMAKWAAEDRKKLNARPSVAINAMNARTLKKLLTDAGAPPAVHQALDRVLSVEGGSMNAVNVVNARTLQKIFTDADVPPAVRHAFGLALRRLYTAQDDMPESLRASRDRMPKNQPPLSKTDPKYYPRPLGPNELSGKPGSDMPESLRASRDRVRDRSRKKRTREALTWDHPLLNSR